MEYPLQLKDVPGMVYFSSKHGLEGAIDQRNILDVFFATPRKLYLEMSRGKNRPHPNTLRYSLFSEGRTLWEQREYFQTKGGMKALNQGVMVNLGTIVDIPVKNKPKVAIIQSPSGAQREETLKGLVERPHLYLSQNTLALLEYMRRNPQLTYRA